MRVFNWLKNIRKNDPVHRCLVFKRHGCCHVDGILCDMKTCSILEEYKLRELEQQLDIPIKDRL